MATKNDIDTDLALELKSYEDSTKFLKAVNAFIGYVEELTKTCAGDEAFSKWEVQVKKASNLLCVRPHSEFNPVIKKMVYEKLENGKNNLQDGFLPNDHSEEALKYLKQIGEVADDASAPKFWFKKSSVEVTKKIADDIDEYLKTGIFSRGSYQDYGSVEGILQLVSEYKKPEVAITDRLTNKKIKCFLNKELMHEALQIFGQRVGAYGKINYRADGTIVNINAEKFYKFPASESIPSFRDVIGIYKVQ